jgi:hypothetical protein
LDLKGFNLVNTCRHFSHLLSEMSDYQSFLWVAAKNDFSCSGSRDRNLQNTGLDYRRLRALAGSHSGDRSNYGRMAWFKPQFFLCCSGESGRAAHCKLLEYLIFPCTIEWMLLNSVIFHVMLFLEVKQERLVSNNFPPCRH